VEKYRLVDRSYAIPDPDIQIEVRKKSFVDCAFLLFKCSPTGAREPLFQPSNQPRGRLFGPISEKAPKTSVNVAVDREQKRRALPCNRCVEAVRFAVR
jgi:hypothetical protein